MDGYRTGVLDPTPSSGSREKLEHSGGLPSVNETTPAGFTPGANAGANHHIDNDQDILKYLRDHFARQARQCVYIPHDIKLKSWYVARALIASACWQLQTRRDYVRLLLFLACVVVYLAILAAQVTPATPRAAAFPRSLAPMCQRRRAHRSAPLPTLEQ